jgi:flavin reductase (DIM6/NTAB) family NADH-FMN oxidoreductase RutF
MDTLHHITRPAIDQLPRLERAALINSLPGFRALNLCGTRDLRGDSNLSILSSVVHLGSNPPLLGMIIRPNSVPRHTLENLEATGSYTLNHLTPDIIRQGHQCSANYPVNVSEFEATGLTPWYSQSHPAPYVAESRIRIGMTFLERIDIARNGVHLVIGEVTEIFLPREALGQDGYVDLNAAGTVCGSALDAYHLPEFVARLTYARPDRPVAEIDANGNPVS